MYLFRRVDEHRIRKTSLGVGDHGNGAKNNQGGSIEIRGLRGIGQDRGKNSPMANISKTFRL